MKDRTVERAQGCWNCIHAKPATEFWAQARQRDLAKAARIAVDSEQGENHVQVVNIRKMVDQVDHAVAQHNLIRCTTGKTAHGQPVGDLTPQNYLCDRWTARDGASLARQGGKLDKLPEELMAEAQPMSMESIGKKLVN